MSRVPTRPLSPPPRLNSISTIPDTYTPSARRKAGEGFAQLVGALGIVRRSTEELAEGVVQAQQLEAATQGQLDQLTDSTKAANAAAADLPVQDRVLLPWYKQGVAFAKADQLAASYRQNASEIVERFANDPEADPDAFQAELVALKQAEIDRLNALGPAATQKYLNTTAGDDRALTNQFQQRNAQVRHEAAIAALEETVSVEMLRFLEDGGPIDGQLFGEAIQQRLDAVGAYPLSPNERNEAVARSLARMATLSRARGDVDGAEAVVDVLAEMKGNAAREAESRLRFDIDRDRRTRLFDGDREKRRQEEASFDRLNDLIFESLDGRTEDELRVLLVEPDQSVLQDIEVLQGLSPQRAEGVYLSQVRSQLRYREADGRRLQDDEYQIRLDEIDRALAAEDYDELDNIRKRIGRDTSLNVQHRIRLREYARKTQTTLSHIDVYRSVLTEGDKRVARAVATLNDLNPVESQIEVPKFITINNVQIPDGTQLRSVRQVRVLRPEFLDELRAHAALTFENLAGTLSDETGQSLEELVKDGRHFRRRVLGPMQEEINRWVDDAVDNGDAFKLTPLPPQARTSPNSVTLPPQGIPAEGIIEEELPNRAKTIKSDGSVPLVDLTLGEKIFGGDGSDATIFGIPLGNFPDPPPLSLPPVASVSFSESADKVFGDRLAAITQEQSALAVQMRTNPGFFSGYELRSKFDNLEVEKRHIQAFIDAGGPRGIRQKAVEYQKRLTNTEGQRYVNYQYRYAEFTRVQKLVDSLDFMFPHDAVFVEADQYDTLDWSSPTLFSIKLFFEDEDQLKEAHAVLVAGNKHEVIEAMKERKGDNFDEDQFFIDQIILLQNLKTPKFPSPEEAQQ